jgi:hypothetical protein
MTHVSPSPVEEAFTALRSLNASWNVEVGRPDRLGWIGGDDMCDASCGFARRGTWGMITSSWAAQFTGLCEDPTDQRSVQPQARGHG